MEAEPGVSTSKTTMSSESLHVDEQLVPWKDESAQHLDGGEHDANRKECEHVEEAVARNKEAIVDELRSVTGRSRSATARTE